MNQTEALRQDTQQIIDEEPTSIALIRPAAKISDGAGGFVSSGNPTTLPAKERYFGGITDFVKIELAFSTLDDRSKRMTPTNILIGLHDDDIRVGDKFVLRDNTYTVLRVSKELHQVKALVGLPVTVKV